MAARTLTLSYDQPSNTFALTTLDGHGYEHVELFTVPAGAPVFVVEGMDCALMRELLDDDLRGPPDIDDEPHVYRADGSELDAWETA